jgi:hypothetical protein
MLPAEDAVLIAEQWVKTHPSLPVNSLITIGNYKAYHKYRKFAVYSRDETLGRTFLLVVFCIRDDKTLKVLKNFRKKVARIKLNGSGFEREDRLFAALAGAQFPRRIVGVRKSGTFADMLGTDGFVDVVVRRQQETFRLEIPFQIKSSKRGRRDFERHPQRGKVAFCFVVRDDASDERLRHQFYTAVGEVIAKFKRGEIALDPSPKIEAAA